MNSSLPIITSYEEDNPRYNRIRLDAAYTKKLHWKEADSLISESVKSSKLTPYPTLFYWRLQ